MNAQSFTQCAWQLSALLKDWVHVDHADDVLVTGVSQHSSDTNNGDLFLATASEHNHGLQYCADAISRGAAAIAWEPAKAQVQQIPDCSVPAIEFEDLSKHVGDITARCYGDITEHIKTIAITGTDGKSSVAHLTAQALENLDEPCGLIGTLGYGRLPKLTNATHTTPPITRLTKELVNAAQAGCRVVAMEASSHGIAQNRLQNLTIYTAVLTNISRDHLDYHGSLEEYIQAKANLFFAHQPCNVVLNYDDAIGKRWCKDLQRLSKVYSYSLSDSSADIYVSRVDYNTSGANIDLHINNEKFDVQTSLLGEFNVSNILAVAAILLSLEKEPDDIATTLRQIKPVPGRMQIVKTDKGPQVIVDFAHTPAALSAAIKAVRKHFAGKLICVFGCGGDRDVGKRSKMGAVAAANADQVVVTSDNPRSEDPNQIIEQIVTGCGTESELAIVVDRREAITYAINSARVSDVVLIAGKGHEKFQQIGSKKLAFDDVVVAIEALN